MLKKKKKNLLWLIVASLHIDVSFLAPSTIIEKHLFVHLLECKHTLTVMTPLRPTFFIAFDMILPISTSPLAEIVATFKIQEKYFRTRSLNNINRY